MCLNMKTLDPAGGSLRCRLDISHHKILNDNLNKLKKRSQRCLLHRWANIKAEKNDVQGLSRVPLFVVLPCIS